MNYKQEIIVKGRPFDTDVELVSGLYLVATPRKCRANNKWLDIEMGEGNVYSSLRGNHVVLNIRTTRQNHIQFLVDDRLTFQALHSIDNPLFTARVTDLIEESMSLLDVRGMSIQEVFNHSNK